MPTILKFYSSNKSDVYYTPEKYLELVRHTLGTIELDPASDEEANRMVKARQIFTQRTDGLRQDWKAKTVFCNPPFSLANKFLQKMIQEFNKENFEVGIFLCNAATSEQWFQPAWNYPICFTHHRIKFNFPEGWQWKLDSRNEYPACLLPRQKRANANTKGQCFVLFSRDLSASVRFLKFDEIGHTVWR